ncbi:MAG: helix-turn-helix transcriptional regulator [Novosphingobium sp.]|nr:helix-turn-helix transcriptional regulator [Novosphingobium sp.]
MKLQKETKVSRAEHGKWYDDACGTAFAMELVGERWSLLIVRELMFGGRRFSDLRGALPGISAKVLTERLEGMERAGILSRVELAGPPAVRLYELTPWGYGAEEPIKALGYWAAQSPDHDPTLPLSAASFMLSLRTMFDPARAKGARFSGAIAIGAERFFVKLGKKGFRAERGAVENPDFSLAAPSASVLAALVYGKAPLAELAEAGLEATGAPPAIAAFVDLFHLPEKAR